MLLEYRLLGNIRVFLEIRFQNIEVGLRRRRAFCSFLLTPFNRTFLGARLSRRAHSHCYFKSAWATLAAGSRTLSSFSSD